VGRKTLTQSMSKLHFSFALLIVKILQLYYLSVSVNFRNVICYSSWPGPTRCS